MTGLVRITLTGICLCVVGLWGASGAQGRKQGSGVTDAKKNNPMSKDGVKTSKVRTTKATRKPDRPIPAIDARAPARTETATFALG